MQQLLHRVLVCIPKTFADASPEISDRLAAHNCRVVNLSRSSVPLARDEFAQALAGSDALFVGLETVDASALDLAPTLKVVAKCGVGVDNIDVAAATERGVVVTNVPGANHEAVADLVIGMMIGLARAIPSCDRRLRAGVWDTRLGYELGGKTLGIVGCGRVGKALARRASGFSMKILITDPIKDYDFAKAFGAKYRGLASLLRASDFVSVNVPLTRETRGTIGERELGLMKKTAFLVNAARGGVVDERALYEALTSGVIAGAGLDVFEVEPPTGSPLLTLDNVITTSHIGGATVEVVQRIVKAMVRSIVSVLEGRRPPFVVNPEVYRNGRLRAAARNAGSAASASRGEP